MFADDVVSKLCYGTMMDVKQMIIAGSEAAQHLGIGQLLWTDELGKEKWKQAFKQVAECRQRCIESLENPRVRDIYGISAYSLTHLHSSTSQEQYISFGW